jgi:hypothetical protein
MFSSAPPRRSSVAWIEPGRRRRRGRGGLPGVRILLALALIAAAGAAAWLVVDQRHAKDMRRAAVRRRVGAS